VSDAGQAEMSLGMVCEGEENTPCTFYYRENLPSLASLFFDCKKPSGYVIVVEMKKSVIQAVMQELGKRGGKARAKNSKAKLSEWGKAGGRPKGSKDTKTRKKRSKTGK
jgi:hypothetical protein